MVLKREIPKLQTLCFRSMGGHGCNAEDTFAPAVPTDKSENENERKEMKGKREKKDDSKIEGKNNKDGDDNDNTKSVLSTASRLLRSFSSPNYKNTKRCTVIGVRRKQANEVDLNHPWIAVRNIHEEEVEDDQKPSTNNVNDDEDEEEDIYNDHDEDEDEENGNIDDRQSAIPPPQTAVATTTHTTPLVMEYGSPSLDLLQQFIDALVELGRMDDNRLGLHFFQEWKANVLLKQQRNQIEPPVDTAATSSADTMEPEENTAPPPTKRRRKAKSPSSTRSNTPTPKSNPTSRSNSPIPPPSSKTTTHPTPLGSLSLHNAIIHRETIQAMLDSQMTQNLAVLDLTGIPTLTDELLESLLKESPNIQRLSLKNCRRITNQSLLTIQEYLPTKLQAIDIGGSYNLQPSRVIELVCHLMNLTELHASGLPWTSESIKELTSLKDSWKALSLGFLVSTRNAYFDGGHGDQPKSSSSALGSTNITGGWKDSLQWSMLSKNLQSLAIPFCDSNSMFMVDAALMGLLGRHLPHLRVLDVRGNNTLSSLTGWYDGRATIQPRVGPQSLLVLARYSGISKASVEDTKRIHPLAATDLNCILDSEGIGMGIIRKIKKEL